MNAVSSHVNPEHRPKPLALSKSHLFYLLAALPLVALVLFVTLRPIVVLPRISVAPGFALTDQDGQLLTSETLRGELVLYNITYIGCQPPCRDNSATLAAIYQQLSSGQGPLRVGELPVRLVSLSIDPERDRPEILRAHMDAQGIDAQSWSFATGTPAALKQIIGGGFGVYYEDRGAGEFILEPALMVVDGWGILRAVYRKTEVEPERILRDLQLLADEAAHSRGVARYAYEAAHLFLCYPG